MKFLCIIVAVFGLLSALVAAPEHYIGAKWPRGAVKMVVEAGAFAEESREAMSRWNEVLAPYGVRIVPSRRIRKSAQPTRADGESGIYLTLGTSNYADTDVRRRGPVILEADVRVHPDRFAPLSRERRILILMHELGHALGFLHYDGPELSILHSRLPQTITGITQFDQGSLASTYGAVSPAKAKRRKR